MTRVEQLEKIFNYLRTIGEVETKADFAKKIGITPSSLSSAFNQRAGYLNDYLFIMRIGTTYPDLFETQWLKDGTGPMLREGRGHNIEAKNIGSHNNLQSVVHNDSSIGMAAINELSKFRDVITSQLDIIRIQTEQMNKLISLLEKQNS